MKFLSLLILFWLNSAFSIELGFNQAWLKNNYAHQWINYDHNESERIIQMAKDANASILKMWLFEGASTEGLSWNKKIPTQLSSTYIKNLEHFIQTAQDNNIQLSFALFDGNIISKNSFAEYKSRWWNLLNNEYNTADYFLKNIIHPVISLLNRYPNIVTQIDLVNEINALNGPYFIYRKMFKGGWKGLNKFVCKWSKFIKKNTRYKVDVTASFGWGNAVNTVISDHLTASCIDFYEIHLYNNSGYIPRCLNLKAFSVRKKKPIQLGEFGQKSKSYNDELQTQNLVNFITNAKKCGITKALAWRLSDIRPGNNRESRFSFESFDKPRPAYFVFKNLNKIHF